MTTPETDSTRDRIVHVALELFSAHGYDGTSLRQVAEAMGFTKAALYYHFESKEALAREVLRPIVDDLAVLLDRTPPARTRADRATFLTDYVDLIIRHREAVRFAFSEVAAVSNLDVAAQVREQGDHLQTLLIGEQPSAATETRFAMTMTGLNGAVVVSDLDGPAIRTTLVEAGLAALGDVESR